MATFIEAWKNQEATVLSQLPANIQPERFNAVVMRAVQEDPALITVDDKMSLFLAAQRAASDGLMPDKREGALVIFKKKKDGNWITGVQWMPMIGGIRKRIAELGFDLRAEAVYENDHFFEEKGDNPRIEHRPPPLGQARGNIIGAYAIAEDLATGNKYREVMDRQTLEQIRKIAKTDNVWAAWFGEKSRVAVAKRLSKQLPISENRDPSKQADARRFYDMMERDNDLYEPGAEVKKASSTAESVQQAARERSKVTPITQFEPGRRSNDEIQGAVDDDMHVMDGDPPEFPSERRAVDDRPTSGDDDFVGIEPGF